MPTSLLRHLLFTFLLLPCFSYGQAYDAFKQQADEEFARGEFKAALASYEACEAAKPGSHSVMLNLGICHFELGNLDQAEAQLLSVLNHKVGASAEAWLYLAKVYHESYRFEKAAEHYKNFLRESGPANPDRAAVKTALLRCQNGIHVRRKDAKSTIVNLGKPLNSAADEFSPIMSPTTSNQIYFAKSVRNENTQKTQSDLYVSKLEGGDWERPNPLSLFLNSTEFEVPLAFCEQGQMLYFFRGESLFSGNIFLDSLRKNKTGGTLFVAEFESPVKAWEGDQDLFIFNDTILLFASRRPGGYGGLDLYVATLRKAGWSAAENLGPVINSAFDERSPFLAKDGRSLYFSTNDSKRSIGGFDIVSSTFLDRVQKWVPAENLGLGFNSAADEEGFFLSPDGSRAFFSSSRKQGFGQRDLYVGIFEKNKSNQLRPSEPVAFHLVKVKSGSSPSTSPVVSPYSTTSLQLAPLQYPIPNMPLTERSFFTLKNLSYWMEKYPQLKVTFVAHTAPGDEQSVAQSALQQVSEVLESENVSLENVAFRNASSSFPLSENDAATHRRIDILLTNPEILPVGIERPEKSEATNFFFQKAMRQLIYHIKIPVEKSSDISGYFKLLPDGNSIERPTTGEVFFLHGNYLTWKSAQMAQFELNKNNFPQARVVPFLRGWELTITEATEYLEAYPELKGFVEQ